jgi:hypothetical protein
VEKHKIKSVVYNPVQVAPAVVRLTASDLSKDTEGHRHP